MTHDGAAGTSEDAVGSTDSVGMRRLKGGLVAATSGMTVFVFLLVASQPLLDRQGGFSADQRAGLVEIVVVGFAIAAVVSFTFGLAASILATKIFDQKSPRKALALYYGIGGLIGAGLILWVFPLPIQDAIRIGVASVVAAVLGGLVAHGHLATRRVMAFCAVGFGVGVILPAMVFG